LVCSNHFQSAKYAKDKRNIKHRRDSHSQYRFDRMTELLNLSPKMNPFLLAEILRNREGIQNSALGFGNEKALNQLLAHHSVIFKPESRIMWVSSSPYQLGAYTAYDLKEIFSSNRNHLKSNAIDSLLIDKDPFQFSTAFLNYEAFRIVDRKVDEALKNKDGSFSVNDIVAYIALNPNYWVAHFKAGLLYEQASDFCNAKWAFERALQKEITTVSDRENVKKALKRINKRIK
jgi:hypothetical protein